MRLLWLADVLRAAGLKVHEVSGWRTRGADSYGPVRGITCHHTAGSRTSSDAGEINTLLNGSSSAPPPIAQLYLSRTGDWHVVASGLCFHNKIGWGGPNEGYGNDALLGIEAQHSGAGEAWTDVQYRSYVRGVAALVGHKASGYDVTVTRVAGHKEHQPGAKTDPSFDMDDFRAAVRAVLAGEDDDMPLTSADIAAVAKAAAAETWRYHLSGLRQDGTKLVLPAEDFLTYGTYNSAAAVEAAKSGAAKVLAAVSQDPSDDITLTDEQVARLADRLAPVLTAAPVQLAPESVDAVAQATVAEIAD